MAHCLVRPSDRPIQLYHCHKDAVRRHALHCTVSSLWQHQFRLVKFAEFGGSRWLARHIFGLTILAFTLGGSSSDSATERELRTVANTPYGVGVYAGEWPLITLRSQALCVTGAEPITVYHRPLPSAMVSKLCVSLPVSVQALPAECALRWRS